MSLLWLVVCAVLLLLLLLLAFVLHNKRSSSNNNQRLNGDIRLAGRARVCVIGAGAAGIAMCRALDTTKDKEKENTIEVVVFEVDEGVGGLWNTSRKGADSVRMYKDLRTNLPKEVMAFTTKHFPPTSAYFPNHESVLSYLKDYASQFNLLRLIRFGRKVSNIRFDKDANKWRVTTTSANSRNSEASSENSRSDDVQEEMFDFVLVCTGHYAKRNVIQIQGLEHFKGEVVHSADFIDASRFANKRVHIVGCSASAADMGKLLIGSGCIVTCSIRKSTARERSVPGSVAYLLFKQLINSGAQIYSEISRIDSQGVIHTSDSKQIKADVLLLATGYLFEYDFLPEQIDILESSGTTVKNLYRHVFWIHNPTLAFIGLPERLLAPWLVFEYQSEWVANVIRGSVSLPSTEEMHKWCKDDEMANQNKLDAKIQKKALVYGIKTFPYIAWLAWQNGKGGVVWQVCLRLGWAVRSFFSRRSAPKTPPTNPRSKVE